MLQTPTTRWALLPGRAVSDLTADLPQHIDLGFQLGDALTLPHMLR
jgi:hypothetical protein